MNIEYLIKILESDKIHIYLSICSFILSIIIFVTSFLKNRENETNSNVHRVAGALLVCSMTFLIHSPYIYFLSIFIIATFITKLDFLENLAAIFKGNKEFWDYRKKSIESKASQRETVKKLEEDRDEILQFDNNYINSSSDVSDRLNAIKEFERMAINKLRTVELFSNSNFRNNVKISFQNGFKLLIDALIKTNSFDYIVEVKMLINRQGINNALKKLTNYLLVYDKHITFLDKHKFVNGILIVPSNADTNTEFESANIFILKYDMEQDKFTNLDDLRSWYIEEMFV